MVGFGDADFDGLGLADADGLVVDWSPATPASGVGDGDLFAATWCACFAGDPVEEAGAATTPVLVSNRPVSAPPTADTDVIVSVAPTWFP